MGYIDFDRLEQIDEKAYQAQRPFPWSNPEKLLSDEGFERLYETLPEISMFASSAGMKRKNTQASHDRFVLEYHDGVSLSEPWREFMAELRGRRYRENLNRLMGNSSMVLNFHWHYTPNGCSVSPHCDSVRKLGSHIFYLNKQEDWDPAWGGETLILDDGGRFNPKSAHELAEFDRRIPSQAIGNRSLIFSRTDRSWHSVGEITCPPGHYRKVFIVVINANGPVDRLRRLIQRRGLSYY
jgi:Rps23 Pro-64 3,4-dihydroxylase Tpa1-like proline 4-hydroxylase